MKTNEPNNIFSKNEFKRVIAKRSKSLDENTINIIYFILAYSM